MKPNTPSSSLSVVEIFDDLDNYGMILVLLETTNHNYSDNTLDTCNTNWHSASMNGVVTSRVAEAVLFPEGDFIAAKLARHEPCTAPPSEHGVAFPLYPEFVIRHDTTVSDGMKYSLLLVGQGYIDDDRCRNW